MTTAYHSRLWGYAIGAGMAVCILSVLFFIVYAIDTHRLEVEWARKCEAAGGHPVRAGQTFLCLAPAAELNP